jgi:hypothetical protein
MTLVVLLANQLDNFGGANGVKFDAELQRVHDETEPYFGKFGLSWRPPPSMLNLMMCIVNTCRTIAVLRTSTVVGQTSMRIATTSELRLGTQCLRKLEINEWVCGYSRYSNSERIENPDQW